MLLPPDIKAEELLSYVRPLYPNGIFPLGTGWQIVLWGVAVILSVKLLSRFTPRQKRRREAFSVFDSLRHSFAKSGDVSVLAADLSVLMRRVALSRFGRNRTAGLNGKAWLDFLRQTGADLNEQDQQLLAMQAYAPADSLRDPLTGKHLLNAVQRWLEHNL